MKNAIIWVVIILIVLLLIWRVRSTVQEKAALRSKSNVVVKAHVEIALPISKSITDAIETWGDAASSSSVTVTSTLSGKILDQKVSVGSIVKKGDLLAKIDRNLQPQEFSVTDLVCPANGVISKKFVDNGTSITSQTPIYAIDDISEIIVKVPVAQQDIGRVRTGMTAELSCEAFPGAVIKGLVKKIYPTTNEQSRATTVEIGLVDSRIKPGMFLKVRLLDKQHETLFVPGSAIQENNGKATAAIYRAPAFRRVPVEIGIREGDLVEIRSGITSADTLISSGADFLNNGDTVVVAGSTQP